MLAVVVGAGLLVHLVLPESAFADIAGDALYVGAVYSGLVLIVPRLQPWIVGGIALVWCVGIELFQLTEIPQLVGAAFPPAMLVLGTVFDPRDLVVYAVAALVLTAVDAAVSGYGTGSAE